MYPIVLSALDDSFWLLQSMISSFLIDFPRGFLLFPIGSVVEVPYVIPTAEEAEIVGELALTFVSAADRGVPKPACSDSASAFPLDPVDGCELAFRYPPPQAAGDRRLLGLSVICS